MMESGDLGKELCPECGKSYRPDLTPGLNGACPHCLANLLMVSSDESVPQDPRPFQFDTGMTFDGIEILEPIARGGMGEVYRGRQIKLNRVVAVKVLDANLAESSEFIQRFEREARALAVLNHPNVVQVFDFGVSEGFCYLVMEWVDGTSLREILSLDHLGPEDALRYVPQICDALEYAHAQGVVHRDIKPDNILIGQQGELKIGDFGIARLREDVSGGVVYTQTGQQMGTPHYMAPEQQKHTDRVDHRADIYSLGVVFYEMLTGELPLGNFPTPSQRTSVSQGVDQVVLKTLAHDPNQRFQRASEIKQALTQPSMDGLNPVERIPDQERTRVSVFTWASIWCSVLSGLVLWEIWSPIFDDEMAWSRTFIHGERVAPPFLGDGFFGSTLRWVSPLAGVMAWVFGVIALKKVKDQPKCWTGRKRTFAAMLIPVCLLVAISAVYLILLLENQIRDGSFTVYGWQRFVFSHLLFLGVTFLLTLASVVMVFRRLFKAAVFKERKFPFKMCAFAVLSAVILGVLAWFESEEYGEAAHYEKVCRHLTNKAVPMYSLRERNFWLKYLDFIGPRDPENPRYAARSTSLQERRESIIKRLFSNRYGHRILGCGRDMRFERFKEGRAHASIAHLRNGVDVTIGWYENSYVQNFRFLDQNHLLWVQEIFLSDGSLVIDYEFPVKDMELADGDRFQGMNVEEMTKKIREVYGAEPDVGYRAIIPLNEIRETKWWKFWKYGNLKD